MVSDTLRLHEVYRNRNITDLKAEIEKGWSSKTNNRSVIEIIAAKKLQKIIPLSS